MKQLRRKQWIGVLAFLVEGTSAWADPRSSTRSISDTPRATAEEQFASDGVEEASPPPGTRFRDCPGCPEMTVVPAGSFTMGSPLSEKGRFDHEGPQHRVSIPRDFAAGVYHVTRAEYATFVHETGRSNDEGCSVWSEGEWNNDAARNWRNPGFRQTDLDPVVCVSWEDAQAYVLWLNDRVQGFTQAAGPSTKAGPYRLLTEAEWEYAARAGTTTPFYWGDENIHDNANAGVDRRPHKPLAKDSDRWEYTSPVGSFPANAFGLHDMLGNAWQWLEDCYHESYTGAPADGTPRMTGECKNRVARGGCWLDSSQFLRAANRGKNWGIRYSSLGFRVARTLQ